MKQLKFCLFALAMAIAQPSLSNEIIPGLVVGVSDGDTVTLLTQNKQQVKIRVQGIDAPERAQAFGQVARQAMAKTVFQKNVEARCPSTDRYGRKICTIHVNGVDAGLQLLNQGLAWHYKQYEREQPEQDRVAYAYAEEMARSRRAGLWSDANPQAPWDFRRSKRN